jgi:hypothetical protein
MGYGVPWPMNVPYLYDIYFCGAHENRPLAHWTIYIEPLGIGDYQYNKKKTMALVADLRLIDLKHKSNQEHAFFVKQQAMDVHRYHKCITNKV